MRALAQRASAVPFFYNDIYTVVLPKTNSFPMQKYQYVREALQKELSPSLASFHESPLARLEDLTAVHDKNYVRRFLDGELTRDENRRIGFPWSPASVDCALSSTGIEPLRDARTTRDTPYSTSSKAATSSRSRR